MEPILSSLATATVPTDPKDRKSLRTTFNVSQMALDELNALASRGAISQKDVIDSLTRVLDLLPRELWPTYYEQACPIKKPVRRTMVISERAKSIMEKKAREFKISRDEVFETMVRLFQIIDERSATRRRELHEQAFDILREFYETALEYEQRFKELLDPGDPVRTRFNAVMVVIENLEDALRGELNGSDPVDPDGY